MIEPVLALVGVLAVLILIALVIMRVVNVVNTYRSGRDMKACVKHAWFLMLVRLDRDLGCSEPNDRLIAQAVFSLLTSSEARDDAVRQLINSNRERIVKITEQVLETDAELRTLAVQTRIWLYAGRWAHGNRASAEKVLSNPFLGRYEHEQRSAGGADYFRLVSELSDKWLREGSSNASSTVASKWELLDENDFAALFPQETANAIPRLTVSDDLRFFRGASFSSMLATEIVKSTDRTAPFILEAIDFKNCADSIRQDSAFLSVITENILSGCRLVDAVYQRAADFEFVLLCPNRSKQDGGEIARLRYQALANALRVGFPDVRICVGVVGWPADGRTQFELLHNLNETMRLAKGSAHGGVAVAELGMLPT